MPKLPDFIQNELRANNSIQENEIAMQEGDLIFAENVLNKERRMLSKEIVEPYIKTYNKKLFILFLYIFILLFLYFNPEILELIFPY